MLSVTSLSARFDDENYYYEPWVSAVVEYRERLQMVAMYRTDESDRIGPHEPLLCLMVMTWNSDRDIEQARAAYDKRGEEGFREYLASGSQLDVNTVFGTALLLGELLRLTDSLVETLSKGLTISSQRAGVGTSQWDEVHLDVADRRAIFIVDVSSGVSRCEQLEELLPPWLSRAAQEVEHPGLMPDEPPGISVSESLAELLSLPVFDPRSRNR